MKASIFRYLIRIDETLPTAAHSMQIHTIKLPPVLSQDKISIFLSLNISRPLAFIPSFRTLTSHHWSSALLILLVDIGSALTGPLLISTRLPDLAIHSLLRARTFTCLPLLPLATV